jgi:hypothetical protein
MVMISLDTSSTPAPHLCGPEKNSIHYDIRSIAQAPSTPSFSSNISFRFPSQMPLLQQPTVTDLACHGF